MVSGFTLQLFRVPQEALVNVAKHAQARCVRIDLTYGDADLRLVIQDDGIGFDDDALEPRAPSPWSGFGLLGMRERLAALGGTLTLQNCSGALVDVVVPRTHAQPIADLDSEHTLAGVETRTGP